MEGNQVGSSPDSLIALFSKRIGELQELVIARNMYPATSIQDLTAIDTALSLMDLQVQSIKDRLREESEAISKPKKLIEASLKQKGKLQKMPIHINICLPQEQNFVSSSLKSDEEAAVLPKEKKGRASISDMASYAEANVHLIAAPKQKLAETLWEKALKLRDIVTAGALKGIHFFLETDMKGPSLKLDNTGKAILTDKKGRASAPLWYITVEELNSLSSLLQENVKQHEQNSVFSSLKSDEEALLGYTLFKLCWDTRYSTARRGTCYSSSVGAIEEDASCADSSREEDASDSSTLGSTSDLDENNKELQFTDPEGILMTSPSRSRVLKRMTAELREQLKKNVVAVIGRESAKIYLGRKRYKLLLQMNPPQQLSIFDTKYKLFIFWKKGKLPVKYLLNKKDRKRLKQVAGFIHNQYTHLLCWAFAICDLVSMCALLYGWHQEFTPMSVMHLCEKVDPESYNKVRKPPYTHCCYEEDIGAGLTYVKRHGLPRETPYEKMMREQKMMFDCRNKCDAVGPDLCFITNILTYDTLEAALLCLKTRPVIAGLICFQGWSEAGIYRGPLNGAKYVGEHTVVMIDCFELDGETVVKCKTSNGLTIGSDGYIYVSVQVMLIEVASARQARHPNSHRCPRKPTYLLSDFYSVEMKMGPHHKMNNRKKNKKRRREQGK